ncbi:hypothetical protein QJS66_21545 [Kocuria rhizophila]|nr:hypothetical protein QJS66_21545 [Kocuria rhizophila]
MTCDTIAQKEHAVVKESHGPVTLVTAAAAVRTRPTAPGRFPWRSACSTRPTCAGVHHGLYIATSSLTAAACAAGLGASDDAARAGPCPGSPVPAAAPRPSAAATHPGTPSRRPPATWPVSCWR